MDIFVLLLLALAVSIDSFSVGFTYGLRKMIIPFHAIVIIACFSSLSLFFASVLGKYIGKILSENVSNTIGGIILILLGVWALFQFFREHKEEVVTNESKVLFKLEMKSIGVVIHILKKPMSADLDRSGSIKGLEAVLLGIALSLDALGAGLGASMLGFSPILLAITVGIMSAGFAFIGIKIGASVANVKWVEKFSFIPGLLLILIGLWRI
ncbi:sporulation membrane protein YtaF [Bacillus kwashiorkori]|uniref:sporulation membrane protein YtaF n=1 Tax=Bacillus kwashiorkori TaxID=1522318 RepID=UPI0007845A20|nr:sporulation membrane protein YtaF [Bacillus kwashiorkori]